MKLGISSFTFGWAVGVPGQMPKRPLTLLPLIECAHAYGLSLLQVGDNLPLHLLPEDECQRAKALLAKYGMELEVGTRGLTEEILGAYLRIATFFGSKILRIVIDLGEYEPNEAQIVALLRNWAPAFERAGVTLAIENHDRFQAKQLARIVRRAGSRAVGICLDTANSLGALEGVETVVDALVAKTVNLHVKDVVIRRLPSQLGFTVTGVPAGDGGIDTEALIDAVRRNGHDANCILEQWTPFEGDLETTIAKEKASADKAVSYLKGLLAIPPAPKPAFGASAAYTISAYGAHFTVADICASMRALGKAGFVAYQPELSFSEALDAWENGGLAQVNACQAETGVVTRQLICHFVLDYFADEAAVRSDDGYAQIARFIRLCQGLDNCRQVLFPIGPLRLEPGAVTMERMAALCKRYLEKLYDFAAMVQEAGLLVSFELLPGNFIGGYDELFRRMTAEGLYNFGVNFDTGHAIANGEDIYRLARVYAKSMYLTHFGDPAQPGGTKQAPGRGMVDWARLLPLLRAHGYRGTLDLEIMCSAQDTESAYDAGKAHLAAL